MKRSEINKAIDIAKKRLEEYKITLPMFAYWTPEKIEVTPGNSITLEPFSYHRFYPKKDAGMLIVGEVSKVNDDNTDNVFLVKSDRFCEIEEDEEKRYVLVNEY